MGNSRLSDKPEQILEAYLTRMAEIRSSGGATTETSFYGPLENLLNSRCFPDEIPASCTELRTSILVYGLADFTSKNPSVPAVRMELRQQIERTIMLFEPRLKNVAVRIENPAAGERRFMFKITALLKFEETSEPVSFDTYFDSNRCEYSISRQR